MAQPVARDHTHQITAQPGITDPELNDPVLVGFLEPDQLVANTARALPAARLGPRAGAALWALRIFVMLVGTMVIYTFIAQLT